MAQAISQAQLNELLRRHRRNAGMTQEALAGRLHIHHSNVSRIESGQQMPDESYVNAFVRIEEFALTVNDVLALQNAYQAIRQQRRRKGEEMVDLLAAQANKSGHGVDERDASDTPEKSDTLKRYLEFIVDSCSVSTLGNLSIAQTFAALPLADVYIPLRARIELPDAETWQQERANGAEARRSREIQIRGRIPSLQEIETIGDYLSAPRDIIKLLQEHSGLVVLGDPGAGKSTLLRFLAATLAAGQGERVGMPGRIPILMPMRAYAQALVHSEQTPLEFVQTYYSQQAGYELPLKEIFQAILKRGNALILWDGLDEVADPIDRRRVVDRVRKFFHWNQREGNRFVITSRIIGYEEAPLHAVGLMTCVLSDFTARDIEDFVAHWTEAVARQSKQPADIALRTARHEEADILIALRCDPGIRQLGANPLLLTLMVALRHRQGTAQAQRAQIYDQLVQTLLHQWNLSRSMDAVDTPSMDMRHTLLLLSELALWVQQHYQQSGLIQAEQARRRLIELCMARHLANPEQEADRLLKHARDYAGILVDLGPNQYGFIHRTFQEYLAAYAIASIATTDVAAACQLLVPHLTDPAWHEVILLSLGCLGVIKQSPVEASDLIECLLASMDGAQGQLRALIGRAATEAGLSGLTPDCHQRVIDMLVALMRDDVAQTTARTRAEAGNALAQLGDPRREVMQTDAMQFCHVPPGPFDMSGDEGTDDEHDDVIHVNTLLDYGYWLGRFPVTNAQFQEFIATGGYRHERYWSEAQALGIWRPGEIQQGFYRWDNNFGGFLFWSHYWSDRPLSYGSPFNLPNHPVNNLSWYECLAFTRWLNDRFDLHQQGWHACLPSDPEWEKACRGGHAIVSEANTWVVRDIGHGLGLVQMTAAANHPPSAHIKNLRRFAWGDQADPNRANYRDADIKTTNAVGIFPNGASPYGCEEMIGNIWEWTRSLWGPSNYARVFHYPYDTTRDREDLTAGLDVFRTLRGGSYFSMPIHARCAYRRRNAPDYVCENLGFRVAIVPLCS